MESNKEYWLDAYGGINNYCSLPCHEQIAIEVINLFPHLKHKRIIDVGSGPGMIAAWLRAKTRADTTILDKSQYALLSAVTARWEDMGELSSIHADISEPIFHDGLSIDVFDLVLCIQVLEHIEESKIDIAIENIWNLSKPGGQALISVAIESNDKDLDHKTLKPWEWWALRFGKAGFVVQLNPKFPQIFDRLGWQTFILMKPE
jgi:2-polyprenyl-3-methyl-5-hydroxy-6-metoxy-1,4-benzoquinol methylase